MKLASELVPWELVCLPKYKDQPRQIVWTFNTEHDDKEWEPSYIKHAPVLTKETYLESSPTKVKKKDQFLELHELDSITKNERWVFLLDEKAKNYSNMPVRCELTELEECWLRYKRCIVQVQIKGCKLYTKQRTQITLMQDEINKIFSLTQYHYAIGNLASLTYREIYRLGFYTDEQLGY